MLSQLNPNATVVQQTREHLTGLISANYPEVKNVQVKKSGWYVSIRANFKNRRIRARASNSQKAVIIFIEDLNRKVFAEPFID